MAAGKRTWEEGMELLGGWFSRWRKEGRFFLSFFLLLLLLA